MQKRIVESHAKKTIGMTSSKIEKYFYLSDNRVLTEVLENYGNRNFIHSCAAFEQECLNHIDLIK
jgi:hypothetical protein